MATKSPLPPAKTQSSAPICKRLRWRLSSPPLILLQLAGGQSSLVAPLWSGFVEVPQPTMFRRYHHDRELFKDVAIGLSLFLPPSFGVKKAANNAGIKATIIGTIIVGKLEVTNFAKISGFMLLLSRQARSSQLLSTRAREGTSSEAPHVVGACLPDARRGLAHEPGLLP